MTNFINLKTFQFILNGIHGQTGRAYLIISILITYLKLGEFSKQSFLIKYAYSSKTFDAWILKIDFWICSKLWSYKVHVSRRIVGIIYFCIHELHFKYLSFSDSERLSSEFNHSNHFTEKISPNSLFENAGPKPARFGYMNYQKPWPDSFYSLESNLIRPQTFKILTYCKDFYSDSVLFILIFVNSIN